MADKEVHHHHAGGGGDGGASTMIAAIVVVAVLVVGGLFFWNYSGDRSAQGPSVTVNAPTTGQGGGGKGGAK